MILTGWRASGPSTHKEQDNTNRQHEFGVAKRQNYGNTKWRPTLVKHTDLWYISSVRALVLLALCFHHRARVKKCAAKKTEQVLRILRNFESRTYIVVDWTDESWPHTELSSSRILVCHINPSFSGYGHLFWPGSNWTCSWQNYEWPFPVQIFLPSFRGASMSDMVVLASTTDAFPKRWGTGQWFNLFTISDQIRNLEANKNLEFLTISYRANHPQTFGWPPGGFVTKKTNGQKI